MIEQENLVIVRNNTEEDERGNIITRTNTKYVKLTSDECERWWNVVTLNPGEAIEKGQGRYHFPTMRGFKTAITEYDRIKKEKEDKEKHLQLGVTA